MTMIKSFARKAVSADDQTLVEISIIQLARKRTLMRSVEQSEYKLQAAPASKLRYRDAPRMECASLKKMYDRSALAQSVRGAIKLRVLSASDINDRSAPIIDADVRLRFSERRAFLYALLMQVEQFYLRVLSTARHISTSSLETAIYMREHAPIVVSDMVEASTHKVHDMIEVGTNTMHGVYEASSHTVHEVIEAGSHLVEAGRETAAATIPKATNAIDTLVRTGSKTASKAKVNAQGLLETSQENASEIAAKSASFGKDVAAKISAIPSAVAGKVTEIYHKGKNLLSSEPEEILLTKRSHKHPAIRRARTEAAIYKAYAELLIEVELNRQNLNHVLLSEIRDRSKPFIMSPEARQQNATKHTLAMRGAVLSEIKRSATCMTLNHVSIRDTSCPAVPPTVRNLQSDDRKKLVSEIESTDRSQVLHATPVPTSDRSAPVLPFGNSIQLDKYEATKKSMLQLVKAGVDLAPFSPRLMKDRSAPLISSPGLGAM